MPPFFNKKQGGILLFSLLFLQKNDNFAELILNFAKNYQYCDKNEVKMPVYQEKKLARNLLYK